MNKISYVRFCLFVLCLLLAAPVSLVYAEEQGVKAQLDSYTIPSKSGEAAPPVIIDSPDPNEIPTKVTDPSNNGGSTPDSNPAPSQPGNGNDPNSKDSDLSNGGNTSDPQTGKPSVSEPNVPVPGTSGTGSPAVSDPIGGQTSPPVLGPPASGSTNGSNPGNTNTGNANAGNTNSGNADTNTGQSDSGTNTQTTNPGDTKESDGTPWYKTLLQGAQGALAGGIGAAIAIGVVVGVAAILGVTIGAPVLIAALAVGVVAGVVYALVAGDSFSFLKGIGIGGLAALTVISLGQAGIGAAVRGAFQLLRSAGLRGAARAAVSRTGTFLKGAWGSLRSGLSALKGAPLQTLKSTIISKTFGFTVGINLATNVFGKLFFEGKLPTLGEAGVMLAESVAGALVFDKIGDVMAAAAASRFGKHVSAFFASMVEAVTINLAKNMGQKADAGEAVQTSFIKAFILQPIFRIRIGNARDKNNIGTAVSDLEGHGISIDESLIGSKSLTNKQLNQIWNNTANPNSVQHWQDGGHQLTQKQFDQLKSNQTQLDKVEQREEMLEKSAEKIVEDTVKKKYYVGR